jgi:D-amino peptidase
VRVYISVDMEGIAGVNHPASTDPADRRYPVSVDLMVGETNAAIEGALAAGATDILVNDSHWNMYNLLPADLHPSARVLQGQKAWSMVAGARPGADRGPSFDVALFVGYHARAGHPSGTIAHTYSDMPVETRLDGRPTGEYGVNALALGAWGIPVGMVAGDDALAEEVEGWLPWAERVVVKTIDGGRSAVSVHPTVARDRIREGAERAVERAAAGELQVLEVGRPVAIEIDVPRGVIADHAAIMPGVERVGDRTIRFAHDDPETVFRGMLAILRLVESVSG